MAYINDHYLKLKAGYLFPEIARRVEQFVKENPGAKIIRLGIGDVTEPLPGAVIEAMHRAVDEMSRGDTFRGYGPEQGYSFLREKIVEHDFRSRGCDVEADEVFISDGSKCDTANILDILGPKNRIAVVDPVYPVYVDTNVMAGHTGVSDESGRYARLVYLPATAKNDFIPGLPRKRVDVVYLCYPNNPTGAVATKEALSRWVEYAHKYDTLILFDAAYEAYITDPAIPHSIYEIPGAKDVAIEFRSFSKTAGFTGTRCAFTVLPKSLSGKERSGNRVSLHKLWSRRQTTKFNGAGYVVQRAAEAVYTPEGRQQVRGLIEHYLGNAKLIRETLASIGFEVHGGVNAPYVWVKTPQGMNSWEFFDHLLSQAHIVGTPGSGFGAAGEGYFRLSAFNSREKVLEATQRMQSKLRV